ncbi:regulator of chromosome condensation 1/beta-lactamase-inhibitor protein II [Flagelloscypha sp. PMI_526]|nr:regulator of chromosome condensation 1/beta-lactamase-inhibitor protein II [Flagelloscypha sp. PMI_526]
MQFVDIPVEVFTDHIFPSLPIRSLLRLASTCTLFAGLCEDETVWKRRIDQDYNFSGAGTARTSGWKFIYKGLFKPRVYVWGEKSQGRLGLEKFPKSSVQGGLPYPTQLKTNAKIVAIVAGGMSFHALDTEGNIHVMGTLDGTGGALNMEGYDRAGKKAATPLRLKIPAPTRTISCGRLHSTSLDNRGDVWTFLNWGRPFRLVTVSEYLDQHNDSISQVESGWSFSVALTRRGEVIVWYPFGSLAEKFREQMLSMSHEEKKSLDVDGVIQCHPWDFSERQFTILPELPSLPSLPSSAEADSGDVKLIKIAGLVDYVVGLTNKGHVLKFGPMQDEEAIRANRWEYLPKFSELEEVKAHPTFSPGDVPPAAEAPDTLTITHISGTFNNFTAYSSEVVLIGDVNTTSETMPRILPDLQRKGVISIVMGDYHNAALTSDGKLFTWGGYSKGALGLGDPTTIDAGKPGGFATEQHRLRALQRPSWEDIPAVETPTEVRFDHNRKTRKDRFCFSVTASGWHTGALVIDLEPDAQDEANSDAEDEATDGNPSSETPSSGLPPFGGPGTSPPILPGHMRGGLGGIFRIGHAGRGIGLGRGNTLPVQPPPPGEPQ